MNTLNVIRTAPRRKQRPKTEATERYRRANEECARLILEDQQRYGGPGALIVRWAHAVQHGVESDTRRWRLLA